MKKGEFEAALLSLAEVIGDVTLLLSAMRSCVVSAFS